jgi:integrase/recombinase XerD
MSPLAAPQSVSGSENARFIPVDYAIASHSTKNKPEKSPEQWRALWISKARRILGAMPESSSSEVGQCIAIIGRYLENNPYSPYYIRLYRLERYLRENAQSAARVLHFFYRDVAPSEKHIECIEKAFPDLKRTECIRDNSKPGITSSSSPHLSAKDLNCAHVTDSALPDDERLLAKLRLEVSSRNYSQSTLKNYNAAVVAFLDWLTPEKCHDWPAALKEHLVWLHDVRKLAPSSVNLHSSSILFFFREVLEIEAGNDLIVRMKTGKPLPKVHSRQNAARIINTPSNIKHRLMLMLAYGCGPRLNEIRNLRLAHMDLDRKVVWVRKGKGKKDRIVMLDPDLATLIERWMKSGCGAKYLFEGYTPGKAISKRTIEKVYEKACEKIGIDRQGGIHSLRHSFATHLLEQGCNLRYIQDLLGHASPKTTEIYTHVAANKITEITSPIAGLINHMR